MNYTYKGIWEALRAKIVAEIFDERARKKVPSPREKLVFKKFKSILKYMDKLEIIVVRDSYSNAISKEFSY